MNKILTIALISFALITPCNGQEKASPAEEDSLMESKTIPDKEKSSEIQPANQLLGPLSLKTIQPDPSLNIGAYVRRVFQDKNGNLWFGTYADGVIRYDGDTLRYFSVNEGLGGSDVRAIVEDEEGNVWFGTSGGLSKYDSSASLATGTSSFTNFTENDGLVDNDVWSIAIDRNGMIWVGTLQGVSRFDGEKFTPFALPEAESDTSREVTSTRIVHCIIEDHKGKIWLGTNGGAYIYDGKTLSNISEKDGLCNNAVNAILEDKDGNIWFATHHRGVCRLNMPIEQGHATSLSFTQMSTAQGDNGTETAWDLYEDKSGNIWFPVSIFGVHRYDGNTITDFFKGQNCVSHTIQCAFEDAEGRLWLGGWSGLFRYDG